MNGLRILVVQLLLQVATAFMHVPITTHDHSRATSKTIKCVHLDDDFDPASELQLLREEIATMERVMHDCQHDEECYLEEATRLEAIVKNTYEGGDHTQTATTKQLSKAVKRHVRRLLSSTNNDIPLVSIELRDMASLCREDFVANSETLAVLESQRKAWVAMLWDDRRDGFGI
mmetsp:Transcript_43223/g.92058  ORF Transcript_43223/g.92058 Transcript_43223/m.92058 type:complete len:174 (-) Transcript_43223:198-719(-)